MKFNNSYFRTYVFPINVDSIISISPILFLQAFNSFKKVLFALHEVKNITLVKLLIKIRFEDNTYITLGELISFTLFNSSFTYVLNYINGLLQDKIIGENNYKSNRPIDIIFVYHLEHSKTAELGNAFQLSKSIDKKVLEKVLISGHNVPISKNIRHYGTLIKTSGNLFTISKPKSMDEIYQITVHSDHNHVLFLNKGALIFEFRDFFKSDTNDFTFTRIYRNKEFHYINGRLLWATHVRPSRFFLPKQTAQKLSQKKFFTLDIETLKVNNVLTPICIAIASKYKTWSYFISDYKSQEDMFLYAINSLIKPSNNNAIIYIHNLARFDGVFLLKWLSKLTDFTINPIIKDGLIYEIQLIWTSPSGKKITLYFRDSYLLLPRSLRDLALAFGVSLKGWFPFDFLNNLGVDGLLYEGLVPDISYYGNITELEYQNILLAYKDKPWSLRKSIIEHCENDCRVLWEIMDAFNKLIFKMFSINIFKSLTLPSLSMQIFKAKYLTDINIPVISGPTYDFIKQSYRGGHTDLYIPQAGKSYVYDINSLFPTVMRNCDYPVGKMIHFRGNIFIDNKYVDAIGFIKCKITAPNNLLRPVLTTKINTPNGTRTVAPLGTWIDVITTGEYWAYKDIGYQFEIFEGYLSERANPFINYINLWSNIKQEPGSVMYFISKLFQNSLYGRFGLNPNLATNVILTDEELENLFKDNPNVKITNVINLEDGKTLIQINKNKNLESITGDVNIGIASTISANARIFMSRILINPEEFFGVPGLVIYYTDTDSIVTNLPLPARFVGKELGQFKLEHIFEEAVFLAPKVYGGLVWNEESKTFTEIIKAKGFKGTISYQELKSLLVLDSAKSLTHEKWFRSLEDGNITIKDSIYTLSVTNNKRKNIYVNNIFTNTKPFTIDENKNIVDNE